MKNVLAFLKKSLLKSLFILCFLCSFGCSNRNLSQKLLSEENHLALQSLQKLSGEEERELVPDLIEALQHENQEIQQRAILVLGKIGVEGKKAISALKEIAQSEQNIVIRLAAINTLGEILAKELIPFFLENLYHQNKKIQSAAFNALIKTTEDSPEFVTACKKILTHPNFSLVLKTVRKLGTLGPKADSASLSLIEILQKTLSSELQEEISRTILLIHSKEIDTKIALLVQHPRISVRYWSSWCLIHLRDQTKQGIPALLQALKEKENSKNHTILKRYALLELGLQIRNNPFFLERGLISLIALLSEEELDYGALKSIQQLGKNGKKAIPYLFNKLKDKDQEVRKETVVLLSSLSKSSPKVLLALLDSLQDENDLVRLEIVKALGVRWSGQAAKYHQKKMDGLLQTLEDKSPIVRREAAWILGAGNIKAALPLLLQLIQDKNPETRLNTITVLTGFQSPTVTSSLLQCLQDPFYPVAHEAAKILGEMNSKEAFEFLVEELKANDIEKNSRALSFLLYFKQNPSILFPLLEEKLTARQPYLRNGAIRLFGFSKDPKAIPLLVASFKDDLAKVRWNAMVALKEINPSFKDILPSVFSTFPLLCILFLIITSLGIFVCGWGIIKFLGKLRQHSLKSLLLTPLRKVEIHILLIVIVGASFLLYWLQLENGLWSYEPSKSILKIVPAAFDALVALFAFFQNQILGIVLVCVFLFYNYLIWSNSEMVRTGKKIHPLYLAKVASLVFFAILFLYTFLFMLLRFCLTLRHEPYAMIFFYLTS